MTQPQPIKATIQDIKEATKLQTKEPESPQSSPVVRSVADFFTDFQADHKVRIEARDAVINWLRRSYNGDSCGLVLWSKGYGRGKTHLAKAAFEALRGTHVKVSYLREKEFYEKIKASYQEGGNVSERALFLEWADSNIIFDDLGKAYVNSREWAEEKYFDLLDRVTERSKSILVTSNLDPDEMMHRLGGAAWSRLVGLCGSSFVNMSNLPDFRMKGIA